MILGPQKSEYRAAVEELLAPFERLEREVRDCIVLLERMRRVRFKSQIVDRNRHTNPRSCGGAGAAFREINFDRRCRAVSPARSRRDGRREGDLVISANMEWIELIPAGTFSTNDGRGPFYNSNPQAVIRLSRALMEGGLPIDFDHATDRAAPQGLPAPAAGWIREVPRCRRRYPGARRMDAARRRRAQGQRISFRVAGIRVRSARRERRRRRDRPRRAHSPRSADE